MLRERSVGESLWEAVLPAELRELPVELGKVDAILDEDRFLAPFRSRLIATIGWPTIPVETYMRLMYLKHRYALGCEALCREVADSFTWRRFCRIALDGRVPDPSTLMKLTKRLGSELLEELNAELLSLAVERKVLRSRRLRVDTTVVESDALSDRLGVVRACHLAADPACSPGAGGGAGAADEGARPAPLGRQASAADLGHARAWRPHPSGRRSVDVRDRRPGQTHDCRCAEGGAERSPKGGLERSRRWARCPAVSASLRRPSRCSSKPSGGLRASEQSPTGASR
jgi:Transposase domain (DUF772)